MIAKIKVPCGACMHRGYKTHYHTNSCYSGLSRTLFCNRNEHQKEDCQACDCLGYIICIGEVLELNPRES
jgi:hypothetical protein